MDVWWKFLLRLMDSAFEVHEGMDSFKGGGDVTALVARHLTFGSPDLLPW